MGWRLVIGYLAWAVVVAVIGSERRTYQVQQGSCSYTFLLPEVGSCGPAGDFRVTNSLQRDSPVRPDGTEPGEPTWQKQRLENLETVMENNTQWLQKESSELTGHCLLCVIM